MGPLNNEATAQKMDEHVADALERGARARRRRQRVRPASRPISTGRRRCSTEVTEEMDVAREETFGPVVPIVRIASDEEAAPDRECVALRPAHRGVDEGSRARAPLRRGGRRGLGEHQRVDELLGEPPSVRRPSGLELGRRPRRWELGAGGVHRAEDGRPDAPLTTQRRELGDGHCRSGKTRVGHMPRQRRPDLCADPAPDARLDRDRPADAGLRRRVRALGRRDGDDPRGCEPGRPRDLAPGRAPRRQARRAPSDDRMRVRIHACDARPGSRERVLDAAARPRPLRRRVRDALGGGRRLALGLAHGRAPRGRSGRDCDRDGYRLHRRAGLGRRARRPLRPRHAVPRRGRRRSGSDGDPVRRASRAASSEQGMRCATGSASRVATSSCSAESRSSC